MFTKDVNMDLFICQIYFDDIIFGSTNDSLSHEFATMMSREFEMSMIGELTFFLGFQVKQMKEGMNVPSFIHLFDFQRYESSIRDIPILTLHL